MEIRLDHIGRRFNKEWIFRNVDYRFVSGQKYAVLGPNGSGKSTLLSILLGNLTPSEGRLQYSDPDTPVEKVYQYLSFAGPYLDLVEEFTLTETINFHFQFKNYAQGLDAKTLIDILGLEKAKDKALKHFSSGMKQRTKLALACCADTPILILDEPTSNLDEQGVAWYHELMDRFANNRITVIGSNQAHEYDFCEHRLSITDYK